MLLANPSLHHLAWSPDATTISYSDMGGGFYLMAADGTGTRRVLDGRYVWDHAWSPDGEAIAVTVNNTGDRELLIVDPDGRILRRLDVEAGWMKDLAWSPDGSLVTYDYVNGRGPLGIWAIPSAGGVPAPLTEDGFGASWSPDGCRIAFQAGEPPSASRVAGGGVTVMRWDGTGRTVVFNGGKAPRWSPTGDRILVDYGSEGITVADGPDYLPRRIHTGALSWARPSWSPDGTRLAFADSSNRLWVVHMDGTAVPVSTTPESAYYYAWWDQIW